MIVLSLQEHIYILLFYCSLYYIYHKHDEISLLSNKKKERKPSVFVFL